MNDAIFMIEIQPGKKIDILTFTNSATDEQIQKMFYGLAESSTKIAGLALYGIIDHIDTKRPGFAKHIKKEMLNFKSK